MTNDTLFTIRSFVYCYLQEGTLFNIYGSKYEKCIKERYYALDDYKNFALRSYY